MSKRDPATAHSHDGVPRLDLSSADASLLQRISTAVDLALFGMFEALGAGVARRPRTVIAVTALVAVLCAAGIANIEVELNGEKLYVPTDSEAWGARRFVEGAFGSDPQRSSIYVTRRGVGGGGSVLTRAAVLELFDVMDAVRQVSAVCKRGSCKDRTVGFSDVILTANGGEDVSSALDFFGNDRAAVAAMTDEDVAATVNQQGVRNAAQQPVRAEAILGGITRAGGAGAISAAEATVVTLVLRNNVETVSGAADQDPATTAWSLALSERLRARNSSLAAISIYPLNPATEQDVQDAAIGNDVGLISFGYVLLMVYSAVVLGRSSWRHSQANLALWSVVAVVLAIGATFGVLSLVGVTFNLVVQSLSLLLLSLGLDDTYVIMEAYGDTADLRGPVWRMGRALGRAGSSIALTSATDLVAFLAGTSSSLPALRDFCIYAAVGIVFDFALQVTFFVGWAVLDQQRIEASRADLVPCLKVDSDTPLFGIPCLRPRKGQQGAAAQSRSFAQQLAGEWLPSLLTRAWVKALVLAATLGALGVSAYGVSQLEMDFSIEWFTPDNSWLQGSYAIRDRYFSGASIPCGIYTGKANYPAQLPALLEVSGALAASPHVLGGTARSWAVAFSNYTKTFKPAGQRDADSGAPLDEQNFYPWLREWLDAPVEQGGGAAYAQWLRFEDASRGSLVATRLFFLIHPVDDAQRMVTATKDLRTLAARFATSLQAQAYTLPMLFWDGLAIITEETIRNVVIALVVVGLVTLVLLANAGAALAVTLMVASIDACLLGAMWLLDLAYNQVTAINLVLAIGIAVDYSAHIAHSFLVSTGSGNERMRHALRHIGGSVLNGAVSTFLGVAMLGFSSSYIFQVFFTMWSLIVGLSLWHGVVVLPVLLSLLAPTPVASAANHTTPTPARDVEKGVALPTITPSSVQPERQVADT